MDRNAIKQEFEELKSIMMGALDRYNSELKEDMSEDLDEVLKKLLISDSTIFIISRLRDLFLKEENITVEEALQIGSILDNISAISMGVRNV